MPTKYISHYLSAMTFSSTSERTIDTGRVKYLKSYKKDFYFISVKCEGLRPKPMCQTVRKKQTGSASKFLKYHDHPSCR